MAAIAADEPAGTSMLSITETDSAGRYRLSNVPEGRHYIVAGRVSSLTYYPGGTDANQAKEIAVEAARITSNVDFSVPPNINPLASRGDPSRTSEVIAYLRITIETGIDRKLNMLLTFQKDFPQSQALPEIFETLMYTYSKHKDFPAVSYTQKRLKEDAANVTALIQTSKSHLQQGDLQTALRYADQAVSVTTAMKNRRPPAPYDGPAWESWVRRLEVDADRNLASIKKTEN